VIVISKYEQILNMWRSTPINTIGDLEFKLDNFRVLFAFHSNKIENPETTYHDTREIFENGMVVNFTGNARTLLEQQNQKACYDVLRNYIVSRNPITVELVKEIHLLLTAGTYDERRYVDNDERSGEFKKRDYVTGIYEVGSKPANVEKDILELINEISNENNTNTLKIGTYLHARFEYIHPFADGNGRAGRTLLNYFLMLNDHPPLIVYDEDKKLYYEALEKYDKDEDIEPLYNFFIYSTEKTWNNALSRETELENEN